MERQIDHGNRNVLQSRAGRKRTEYLKGLRGVPVSGSSVETTEGGVYYDHESGIVERGLGGRDGCREAAS